MLTKAVDTTADCAITLLTNYIFDLAGYSAGELVEYWAQKYPTNWIRLAVIEALHQGRYKAVSVEQILAFWQRRGQAMPRFTHEFERLVSGNVPQRLTGTNVTGVNSYPLALKPAMYFSNDHNTGLNSVKLKTEINQQVSARVLEVSDHQPATNGDNLRPLSDSTNCQTIEQDSRITTHIVPILSSSGTQRPIQQFNPEKNKTCEFYIKLKAISQHLKN